MLRHYVPAAQLSIHCVLISVGETQRRAFYYNHSEVINFPGHPDSNPQRIKSHTAFSVSLLGLRTLRDTA